MFVLKFDYVTSSCNDKCGSVSNNFLLRCYDTNDKFQKSADVLKILLKKNLFLFFQKNMLAICYGDSLCTLFNRETLQNR